MNKSWLLIIIGIILGVMGVSRLGSHVSANSRNAPATMAIITEAAAEAAPSAVKISRVVPNAGQVSLSYASIVEKAAPSVVNIYTKKTVKRAPMMDDPFFKFFFNDGGGGGGALGRDRVEQSLGSGVVVRGSGMIITNNHVVEGADEVQVVTPDKREFTAKVVLADPRVDLAVLSINPGARPLPAIRLGDSDSLKVGDLVFAIGNPFGVGQTTTHGIISALARTAVGISDYQFFIQTDAAVNPGNSGGALVGAGGELIGINTAIYSRSGGSNGIGFAIPVSMVRAMINSAAVGKIVRPWLGLEGQQVTAELAKTLRMERPAGILINNVSGNSPGGRAGIKAGDVVFAVDGKEVADSESLRFRVATKKPGDTAVLTLIRSGAAKNITVILQAPPETPARSITVLRGNHLFAGVQVANLSPAFAQELGGAFPDRGVVVTGLVGDSAAARFGLLQQGDIIEAVNNQVINTIGDMQGQLARSASGMSYRINRQGQRNDCTFRAPSQFFCRQ